MIFFPAETTGRRAASTMTAPHCQTHATLSHPSTPQGSPWGAFISGCHGWGVPVSPASYMWGDHHVAGTP